VREGRRSPVSGLSARRTEKLLKHSYSVDEDAMISRARPQVWGRKCCFTGKKEKAHNLNRNHTRRLTACMTEIRRHPTIGRLVIGVEFRWGFAVLKSEKKRGITRFFPAESENRSEST